MKTAICANADIRPEHYRFVRARSETRHAGFDRPLMKDAEPRASWCEIGAYAVAVGALMLAVWSARAVAFRIALGVF